MEEDVTLALPSFVLVPRPGRIVGLTIESIQDYERGERHYELRILDGDDQYTVSFRAELRHLGKPHTDLQDQLPWEYAKYCRELGEFLYFDAPKVLESCLAALAGAFPQPSGPSAPAWHVAMMAYNNPLLTATLSLRPTERSFPECLETLLNHPVLPGRRTLNATYHRSTAERNSC